METDPNKYTTLLQSISELHPVAQVAAVLSLGAVTIAFFWMVVKILKTFLG